MAPQQRIVQRQGFHVPYIRRQAELVGQDAPPQCRHIADQGPRNQYHQTAGGQGVDVRRRDQPPGRFGQGQQRRKDFRIFNQPLQVPLAARPGAMEARVAGKGIPGGYIGP